MIRHPSATCVAKCETVLDTDLVSVAYIGTVCALALVRPAEEGRS